MPFNPPIGNGSGPIYQISESLKATYSIGGTVTVAAAATDVIMISSPTTATAPKKIRVLRVNVTGIATAAGANLINIIKRSAPDTGGTSTTPTPVIHDTAVYGAAQGVVNVYTANPTLGTTVGNLRSAYVGFGTAAAPSAGTTYLTSDTNDQAFVLNPGEALAINLNGATITGASLAFYLSWTEE